MKITDKITNQIDKLPKGHIFTYADVMTNGAEEQAVIKALNRMVIAGKLTKLSKGKYYKAEKTVFGNLEPDQFQVVKDLLESNGKVNGYLTGYSFFREYGFTTQVSNIIQIGKNNIRSSFKRGRYTISFIKQKNEITKDNIQLLQILDAVRFIKKIPDQDISASYQSLYDILEARPPDEQKKMVELAYKYPAATRALIGAMLQDIGRISLAEQLKQTLNPVTVYDMPEIAKLIPNADKWHIK